MGRASGILVGVVGLTLGGCASFVECVDADGDEHGESCARGPDCDDSNGEVFQTLALYPDVDGDGVGSGDPVDVCANTTAPAGYSDGNDDCDDSVETGLACARGCREFRADVGEAVVTACSAPTGFHGDVAVSEAHGPATGVAGAPVSFTCTYRDGAGKLLSVEHEPGAPAIAVLPDDDGASVSGADLTAFVARRYEVSCLGAPASVTTFIDVEPGLPATLVPSLPPHLGPYAVGEPVPLTARVEDTWGNVIAAPTLAYSSVATPLTAPSGFTGNVHVAQDEGTFVLTVAVTGPTAGGALAESETIDVNSMGPEIECVDPPPGAVVVPDANGAVHFAATLHDIWGIETDGSGAPSVVVARQRVAMEDAEHVTQTLYPAPGAQTVEVVAVDGYPGFPVRSSVLCPFTVAAEVAPEGEWHGDGLGARFRAPVLDDLDRSDPDSIADLLSGVVETRRPLLEAAIRAALQALPPREIYNQPPIRILLSVQDFFLDQPGVVGLTTPQEHLHIATTFPSVTLQTRISVEFFSTTTCTLTSTFPLVAAFDADVALGEPSERLVALEQRGLGPIEISQVNSTGCGAIADVLAIVAGALPNIVSALSTTSVMPEIVTAEIDALSELLSTVRMPPELGTVVVNGFDGTPVAVTFDQRLASIAVALGGGLDLRFDTRFTVSAPASPVLGTSTEGGDLFADTSAAVLDVRWRTELVNRMLLAQWRGGAFHGRIDLTLPDVSGVNAEVDAQQPPIVSTLGDGTLRVSLAGLDIRLTHPALVEVAVVQVSGSASCTLVETDGVLVLESATLDGFLMASGRVGLPLLERTIVLPAARAALEEVLRRVVAQAMPPAPLPSFFVPESISVAGFTPGQRLGATSWSITSGANAVRVGGNFVLE